MAMMLREDRCRGPSMANYNVRRGWVRGPGMANCNVKGGW